MVDDSEFLRDAGMRPEGIAGRGQGMPPRRGRRWFQWTVIAVSARF